VTQTIFRVASRHKPYSQLGNEMLRDKRLTLEQRGALALILSYPTNWTFDIQWLIRECGLGRDRARNIIAALTKCGYCQRAASRKSDGTIGGYDFLFTDEPQHLVEPAPENPGPGLSGAGSPVTGNPGPGKSGPITKKDTKKRNKQTPLPLEGEGQGRSQINSDLKSEVGSLPVFRITPADPQWGPWLTALQAGTQSDARLADQIASAGALNAYGSKWPTRDAFGAIYPLPTVPKPARVAA
jgi:hypothetical protein